MTECVEICVFNISHFQQIIECVTHCVRFNASTEWHRENVARILIDFAVVIHFKNLILLMLEQVCKNLVRYRNFTETAVGLDTSLNQCC